MRERFGDADVAPPPAEKSEIERLYFIASCLNVDDVTDESGEPVLTDWKLYVTGRTKELR